MLNYLVPSEDLEQTTRDLCDRIIRTPPMVQWISKRIMRAALDSTLETTMTLTSNAGGILSGSEDAPRSQTGIPGEARAGVQGAIGAGLPEAGF